MTLRRKPEILMLIRLLPNRNVKIGEVEIDYAGAGPLAALEFAAAFVQIFSFDLDEDRLIAERQAYSTMGEGDLARTIHNGLLLWREAVRLDRALRMAA